MASLKAPRFGYSFFSLEAFLEWALSFEALRKFKGHVFLLPFKVDNIAV